MKITALIKNELHSKFKFNDKWFKENQSWWICALEIAEWTALRIYRVSPHRQVYKPNPLAATSVAIMIGILPCLNSENKYNQNYWVDYQNCWTMYKPNPLEATSVAIITGDFPCLNSEKKHKESYWCTRQLYPHKATSVEIDISDSAFWEREPKTSSDPWIT